MMRNKTKKTTKPSKILGKEFFDMCYTEPSKKPTFEEILDILEDIYSNDPCCQSESFKKKNLNLKDSKFCYNSEIIFLMHQ